MGGTAGGLSHSRRPKRAPPDEQCGPARRRKRSSWRIRVHHQGDTPLVKVSSCVLGVLYVE